ncbi:MAG: IS1 family transposase [Planctomycetes bacterium]|nr:IS1 family transposase [Planctomycetota bacterium]
MDIRRFRCRSCLRTFSEQSLHYSHRQRKPAIDATLFSLLVSGVGFRQAGRILRVARRTIMSKFRRLAEQCRRFHDWHGRSIAGTRRFQFDELETFEFCRTTMPVTQAILIDEKSRYIVEQACDSIRPGGRKSVRRKQLIKRHERSHGRRPANSRACVAKVLEAAGRRLGPSARITFVSDCKPSYPGLARRGFGDALLGHERHSGRLPRGPGNPLFPINHTNAMFRDNISRLRRRSWLVSKRRDRLEEHAWIFVAYRNYIRPRFNGDVQTPAQHIGVVDRRFRFRDLTGRSWRIAPASI